MLLRVLHWFWEGLGFSPGTAAKQLGPRANGEAIIRGEVHIDPLE